MDADFLPVAVAIVKSDMAILDVLPTAILIVIGVCIGLIATWLAAMD